MPSNLCGDCGHVWVSVTPSPKKCPACKQEILREEFDGDYFGPDETEPENDWTPEDCRAWEESEERERRRVENEATEQKRARRRKLTHETRRRGRTQ